MTFTWLVLFVVVGLTGAWWWQNHKAQQEEITTMADQSSAELNAGKDGAQNVPLDTSAAAGQILPRLQTMARWRTQRLRQMLLQPRHLPLMRSRMPLWHLLRLTSIPQLLRQLPRRRCQLTRRVSLPLPPILTHW